MNRLKIFYVWDEELIGQCDRIPAVTGRASMVHDLISVYGLLDHVQVVHSTSATTFDLLRFHSQLYIDHLKKLVNIDEEYMPTSQDEDYGIVYDCPPVSDLYKLVSTIAGGSITAAKCLLLGIADVAINWCGGWHHAQRFGAEGFCYVNDIVLAIEKLRIKFSKVLYIDLDVHHGNGVEDAFKLSNSVFTLSFHKYEPGFYPGTGSIEDVGSMTGKGYSCNFPFMAGYSDRTLVYAFEKVFAKIYSRFMPDAVVVQCGADALAHDPHGGAGLTTYSYCECVKIILNNKKPTLLLGGGGYNHTNAARLWTTLTALVTEVKLDENIPEHDQWPHYGPDFLLAVERTLVKDTNTKEYLDKCISTIEFNLGSIEETTEAPLLKRQKADKVPSTSDPQILLSRPDINLHTDKLKKDKTREPKQIKILKYSQSKCNLIPPIPKNSIDVYEFVD